MQQVQREGEVGDELGARDEQEEEEDAVFFRFPRIEDGGDVVSHLGPNYCLYSGISETILLRLESQTTGTGNPLLSLGKNGRQREAEWTVVRKTHTHTHTHTQKKRKKTYPQKLAPSQQTPSDQPTAVSPLRLRQLSTRSGEKGLPAVRAVKSKRPVAQR